MPPSDDSALTQTALELGGDFFAPEEKEGRYTGERFKALYPKLAEGVVSLRCENVTWRQIQKLVSGALGQSVHHYTLKAVWQLALAEKPELIEAEKKALGMLHRANGLAIAERIAEAIDEIKIESTADIQKLMIAAGIATEKGELLLGGATARFESSGEQLVDAIDALAKLNGPTVDADFQDVPVDRLGAENKPDKKGEPSPIDASSNSTDQEKGQSDA
ncbi:MAG: hypothetical protein AAFX93_19600 [Verrucomicrobiota bacterium]